MEPARSLFSKLPRSRQYEIPSAEILVRRALPIIPRRVLVVVCLLALVTAGCGRGEETAEPTPPEGEMTSLEDATATPGRSQIPTRTLSTVPTSTKIISSADLTATAAQAIANVDSSGQPAGDSSITPTIILESTPDTRTITCVVGNTGGEGVFIRSAPQSGEKIEAWWDGSKMVAIGPDEVAGGRSWKNVRDPDGNVGFIAAEYLECGIEQGEIDETAAEPIQPPTPNPDPNVPICVVVNTGGDGVFIRRNPSSEESIKLWDEETEMAVVGKNVLSNSLRWKHVRDPDGNVGYVAARYLECLEAGEPPES